MEINTYDLLLLLGPTYATSILSNNQTLKSILPRAQTKFMHKITKIVRDLFVTLRDDQLANIFSLPKYMVTLLSYKKNISGYCPLCDRVYHRISTHLKKTHQFKISFASGLLASLKLPHLIEVPPEFKQIENNESLEKAGTAKLGVCKAIEIESNVSAVGGFYVIKSSTLALKNECVLCEECGRLMSRVKWVEHRKNHIKCENIECLGCGTVMKQRNFSKHILECFEEYSNIN